MTPQCRQAIFRLVSIGHNSLFFQVTKNAKTYSFPGPRVVSTNFKQTLTVAAHDTRSALRAVEAEISRIQGRRKSVVDPTPNAHLSDLSG